VTARPSLGVAAIALGAVAVALFLVGLAGAGAGDWMPGAAASAPPGGAAPASAAAGAGSSPATGPDQTARPLPGREVYGFLPYWEMDGGIATHLAATDLSTLALFSVTHRSGGAMDERQTGYRRITGPLGRRLIGEAQARGTRVDIVYTSFGAARNRAFFEDAAAQDRWIEVLVAFVEAQGLDGINVDVERLPADLVPAYGAFVGRLREALRERLPAAQVSAATQANAIGAAMAAAAVAAGADRIFLMGYDYRWAGSEPGASAPIARLDGGRQTLAWSLDLYEALGVPVDRTILGLPLYGMAWPVAGPDFGAPAVGRGKPWVPRRNLGVLQSPSFAPVYDPVESVEFYAVSPSPDPDTGGSPHGGAWRAVYYDSPRSLAPKLWLAEERGLAGAGFWALGYVRGLPAYGELIDAFRAGALPSIAAP
jgi:hypothetical protein